ncbi:MAG: hypothetical protein JWP97_1546 [Labilithrix sp.]|nr:hypothetical protein [Labilithrix sp.]
MKRLVVASALCAAAAVLSSSHDASAFELGTPASDHPFRSAQNVALEIRISPYNVQIDEDPALNGKTPFANSFGTSPRFYFGLELDWQVWRIPYVGTIGPGISVGRVGAGRDVKTVSGRTSADETALTIYPLYAVAVLRGDVFFRRLGFPLVPYGKLGIGSGIWRATNAGGTSSADNVSGKGISWGTNMALGLSFALDAIDPGASRNMDNATGINATYIYLEGQWLALNGIAQDHALRVGSNSWVAGLAFEF